MNLQERSNKSFVQNFTKFLTLAVYNFLLD